MKSQANGIEKVKVESQANGNETVKVESQANGNEKVKVESQANGGLVDSPSHGFCLLHMEWSAQRKNKR